MWFRSFTKVLHAFPIPLGNVEFYTWTRTVRILIPTINFNRWCSLDPGQTSEQACSPARAVLLLARLKGCMLYM